MENNKIAFRARYAGNEYLIETCKAEYKNLMELIKDRIYPDGFGECGGMGRCGTCVVCLPDIKMPISRVRNEATTLAKMKFEDPNVRLACQVAIEDSLQGTTILIRDDY